jgi:CDP-Glycerol:Poly(glycerophosphate) glycerophosphotransferase
MARGSALIESVGRSRDVGGDVIYDARRSTTSLLDDMMYRRSRRAVANALHAVDDWVAACTHDRARVLFEAASPMSLAVFQPVLDRLERDPRLEFWYTTSDGAWAPDAIFETASSRERVISCNRARWMKFDAYINTDFWNMTWLNRRARRVHFFHGVAGKYGLDAPTRIAPVVASFDRLMFANRDRLQKYAVAGLVDPASPQAALIGFPKVDCLVDGSIDGAVIRRDVGLDEALPTVLYAPTWSPHSSLNATGVAVIEALLERDVNVIVKLHDRSLDHTERGSGGVDWRRELARFRELSRVHIARGANASPYMCAADAMVTDHSSIGFEYMLLDRPLIVVDCPALIRSAAVSRDKVALMRSAATVVSDAAGVAAAVVDGLRHPRRHAATRRAIATDLFYRAGGATDRAVECIYNLLELPAPPHAARTAAVTRRTFHA